MLSVAVIVTEWSGMRHNIFRLVGYIVGNVATGMQYRTPCVIFHSVQTENRNISVLDHLPDSWVPCVTSGHWIWRLHFSSTQANRTLVV